MRQSIPWPSHNATDVQARRARLNAFLKSPATLAFRDRLPAELAKAFDHCASVVGSTRRNTQRAFENDWRQYEADADSAGLDPLMPSRDFWNTHFIRFATEPMADGSTRRFTTVIRHAAGIAHHFAQYGLPSPTRTFEHRNLMNRLSRLETRQPKKARPLVGNAVTDLRSCHDTNTLRGARDAAISRFNTNKGRRSATLVNMRIELIDFSEHGMKIGIRDEKASRDRSLDYIVEPHHHEQPYCATCAFEQYISKLGLTQGPLFRGIDRWGNVSERAMSPRSITYLLRKNLRAADHEDANSYSSHSYRHGVVTRAVQRGWPLEEIMLLTGHRSKRALLEYIQISDPWYGAPVRSLLDEPDKTIDSERGWRH